MSRLPTVPVRHPRETTPLEFEWGSINWLCNQELDADAQQTLGMVFIHPGKQNPLHMHPNCEELLVVLSGECDHSLGGTWHHLEPGSLIRIPAGVKHNAINRGWEPVRMLICYSSPDRRTEFFE